jgi:hypothetical protein
MRQKRLSGDELHPIEQFVIHLPKIKFAASAKFYSASQGLLIKIIDKIPQRLLKSIKP